MRMTDYERRIKKVIDFIGQHLDETLKLEDLCQVACFSKYHFHRLFTAYTGVSLQNYIKWLRLKRAAYQLVRQKNETIMMIALNAGFQSHEAFSRSFKHTCGQSPRCFRVQPSWQPWKKPPYLPRIRGEKIMTITIKELPKRRLAVMEHYGDPLKISETVDKLSLWAKSQSVPLKFKPGNSFGFAYNDPHETPAEEFRFDLALTIPENLHLDDKVLERFLPAGRYAITLHKGSHENISETISSLYRDWLPESGEELGTLPCIFCYLNFSHEVAETALLTEIWVLLK